jgi:glycosyltransferase involved in cell wall biosynthesis
MKKELEVTLRLPSKKLIRLNNPLDREKIDCDSKKPLPDDFDCSLPFILSVGRLAPPKDFITLLKAFKKTFNNGQMRLVILGEGPDRHLLEALARELSIEDKVALRGFDSNPYRWMARASVFVLSSCWEGCPNVVLEAKALGLPIIMSEYAASAREIGGRATRFFPVGDIVGLAKLLSEEVEPNKTDNLPLDYNSTTGYLVALGCGL